MAVGEDGGLRVVEGKEQEDLGMPPPNFTEKGVTLEGKFTLSRSGTKRADEGFWKWRALSTKIG